MKKLDGYRSNVGTSILMLTAQKCKMQRGRRMPVWAAAPVKFLMSARHTVAHARSVAQFTNIGSYYAHVESRSSLNTTNTKEFLGSALQT